MTATGEPASATYSPRLPGIGVDFGTSNTAAAVYDGERVILIPLEDDGPLMPSALYVDREFLVSTGKAAINAYISANQGRKVELSSELVGEQRMGTGQIDSETRLPTESPTHLVYGRPINDASMPGRLFRGIKRLLGNASLERLTVFERSFRLVALVTPLLLRVRKAIELVRDEATDHACIGHPVNFEGMSADHNRVALERLQEAYHHAGIRHQRPYPEPNAAALSFLRARPELRPNLILSVDFGGGTLDFCLLERHGDEHYEVRGVHGVALGGDHVDQLLFRHLLFPLLGKGERWVREVEGKTIDTLFPFELYEDYLLNWTISYMLNQNEFLTPVIDMKRQLIPAAPKFERLYELITQNYSYRVFQALRDCKELLSDREQALLDVPELDLSLMLRREQFETLIAEPLRQFEVAVTESLSRAGVRAEQVELVLRTGGSCLIPAVGRILDRLFPGRVVQHDPFTSVAAGLAIADYEARSRR
jgi:hypothetical chaperone protein